MNRVLMVISLTAVFLLFQNCQQASYSAKAGSPSSKAEEIEESEIVEIPTDDDDDVREVIEEEEEQEEGAQPGDQSGNFVCILEGPGKSIKLGLQMDDKAQGQHKVPRVMCMSKEACLVTAALKFDVKGAYFRGYCKANGNPHVIHVTNAQLKAKIGAL